ncbi:MAG: DEAD/DEAH box helicase [Defluviitaleaceae bacterium]|nr:DEAD/DEAH box helicase [Defluviitaleaceae bacterium]
MFNPIDASSKIKRSFVDYITTSLHFADSRYDKLFRERLEESGVISKGPYLDIGGSFKNGKSLKQLAKSGQASELFATLENVQEKDKEVKLERPLYSHQELAMIRANAGHNLVVTTGTGSGKTECFLLPILNSLLEEKRMGKLTDAVRAIIIYPMNALANDQMKRLREMLKSCPEITFGIYTGNTEQEQGRAIARHRDLHEKDPLPNEKLSRKTMQQTPPHILITNYSMLEYMMLRPKDDAVFSGANLRYIVLDEAHVYRGATGIETALLMRRLRARINSTQKAVQYILTSATLGGKDADDEIVAFAENLCSAFFSAENIIRSEEVRQPMVDELNFPDEMFAELYGASRDVGEVLKSYNADFSPDGDASEKLFELMIRCNLFAKLREVTTNPKTVETIARDMNISHDLLVHLVSASAKAVRAGTSLIKARYHFFLRALEGVFITLSEVDDLYLTRKEYDAQGDRVFECAICTDCGRIALAGDEENVKNNNKLTHAKPYDEGIYYFLLKHIEESGFLPIDDKTIDASGTDDFDYVVCSVCGAIDSESYAMHKPMCEHGQSSYVKVRLAEERNNGNHACPACEFGNFRRFYVGYEAATAVTGSSLYEQLPKDENVTVATKTNEKSEQGLFGFAKNNTKTKKAKARQFLIFSDSRADAAFFATYMDKSFKEFLRRRGFWQMCDKKLDEGSATITVRDAVSSLARLFEGNGSFVEIGKERESQSDICRRQAYITVMNELASSKRASGLVQLGKLSYKYAPKSDDRAMRWRRAIEVVAENIKSPDAYSERDAEALLNLIIHDVVYSGALDAGEDLPLTDDEREYLFYVPKSKKIVKNKSKGSESFLTGWIPRQRTGKKKSYFSSTRMTRIMRAMDWEEDAETAWKFLEEIWRDVLCFEDDTHYALSVNDFDIVIHDTTNKAKKIHLFRCDRCGKVTAHNCQDRCVNVRCDGKLYEYESSLENTSNHYIQLYKAPNMNPFYIKEHTAQLSRERGAEYQRQFVEKRINALSSSTTFEMGVDVGSLETVFLRNVPPTPANYVQRAGRAGRSLQSAAYALTYAKLSSHDFTYFDNPENMISGRIKAPMFQLKNEKIIRRHINAVALSAFLRERPEVYDSDNQSNFLNGGGYENFKAFLKSKPSYLKTLLLDSIPDDLCGIHDWSWTIYLIDAEAGILESSVRDFRETIGYFEGERLRYLNEGNAGDAYRYERKLRDFRADKNLDKNPPRKSLIDFLVRNNVLPKYGFPVDTVELLPRYEDANEINRPQMQRDLQLAIAEYAPGSEIVADGMQYTSRYIHKSPSKNNTNWEYGWYAECPDVNCVAPNYYRDTSVRTDLTCRTCGQEIGKFSWQRTLEPRKGFIAGNDGVDAPKPARMRKPDKNYKTDDIYIGDPGKLIISSQAFTINDTVVKIESTANDSLVVRTRDKFAVCEYCGYSKVSGETYSQKHKNAYGSQCSNNEEAGREYFLTHEFKTDVARITFETPMATDFTRMLSVLFAVIEAMSKELDIERNDIKGCLHKTKLQNGIIVVSLIVYDAVAGGAGHSRRLVTPDGTVLSRVIRRAAKAMNDCNCEPSCYKCLRNYYNQKIHDELSRFSARDFLFKFTDEIVPCETIQQ